MTETTETPLWRQQFPAHFDVPELLTTDPDLDDLSYGNDVCPSFTTKALADYNAEHPTDDSSFDLRLWVEHPDPEMREVPGAVRFAVHDMCDTLLFESETDLDGALAMLKRISGEILAKTYHPKNYPQPAPSVMTLAVHATCPRCGFNFPVPQHGYDREGAEVIRFDNGHDGGRGGYRVSCDSCGKPSVIEKHAVNDLQHTALVLLGED